ncbi:RNA-binding protein [Luteitalea sp. TBR-22]|uniref:CRTAC1 family protein n=1 Tax=Luteitalea sp. TBR-22 TaxID=2802971 RepID=UPI001AFA9C09|nr:CRTAC1 family protein [Luteitalea sp. TBR-22]BCS35242.1 RNA-binding protein [Luteitalea sp. TBR-22]
MTKADRPLTKAAGRAWALVFVCALGVLLTAQTPAPRITLTDVTQQAGIAVVHRNGAAGRKFLPETMGAGAAFLDYDNDGDQDVLFVHGLFPGGGGNRWATLYRNDGTGRFADVSIATGLQPQAQGSGLKGQTKQAQGSGLKAQTASTADRRLPTADTPLRYGMGVAAADMDNDGWTDVVLTSVGGITLLRNERGERFTDVTARAGLAAHRGFSTCALWVDVDRDGLVDLLVCNYVQWTPQTDLYCSADGRQKTYCTPQAYRGSTSWLFRNAGQGRFVDVTAKAGLFDVTGKALGATVLDHDSDGWPDLFVANDTVPNRLYRNNHDGTFAELGLQSGVAFSTDGRARAGMGVDAADVDNSGRASVAVTNFSGEMLGLFVPQEAGVYVDAAPQSAVGRATRQTLGWGCFFFDVNLDGWQDLLVVNGQLDPSLTRSPGEASPPHLFVNRQGRFDDVARAAGPAFAAARIGRGAAFADVDGDGDPDVVVTSNGGPAQLFRNDSTPRGGVVGLRLRGTAANRDAVGTRVTGVANGQRVSRVVRTGSSYLSQSELVLTVGLGAATALEQVVVEWPGRPPERLGRLAAGSRYDVVEGRGVVGRTAYRR